MLKKRICLIVFILLLIVISSAFAQEKKELVFGVLSDGTMGEMSAEQFEKIVREAPIIKEIESLLENEYKVQFPLDKVLVGDWTRETNKENLNKLLSDPEVDFVLAMGLITSDIASHMTELSKPVIAPIVLDDKLQNLPRDGEGSGVKNLNYLVSVRTIEDALESFHQVFKVDHYVVFWSKYYLEAVPNFKKTADINTEYKVTVIPVGESIEEAVSKIPEDVFAAMITPLNHLPYPETLRLISMLNEKKIATFSYSRLDVENGALVSDDAENIGERLLRRIALNIQRILMGEEASELPVEYRLDKKLVINMETARKIGYVPSYSVLWNAELLNERSEEEKGERLTLLEAINEAIESNLEILSKQQEVAAEEQNIRKAWSNLFPKLTASATGVKIDEDRALYGTAENTFSGSLSLTQVLFSEEANATISIQKMLQNSREAELEMVKQDIILATAAAYLNVLKARAYERIRKENMKVTQSNLELAKIRQNIGVAGPGEVYRWEYELSLSKTDVFEAENTKKQADFQLNRLLHRPQEEPFSPVEISLNDSLFIKSVSPLIEYINNPLIFKKFRDYSVKIGLEESSELRQINNAIDARERALKSVRNAFYLPNIYFSGEVTQRFEESGSGTEPFEGKPDDLDWQIAVQATFPLFSGGERIASYNKTKIEIKQLETQKRNISEKLEQRIRSTVYQTGNSHAQIRLAYDAAEAANKTLELVTDSYKNGAASILDLIDAQRSALVSELGASNAIYDFLMDLMELQRSVNSFDFMLSPEGSARTFEEFEQYLGRMESSEEDE